MVAILPEASYPFSSLPCLIIVHHHYRGDLTHIFRVLTFIRMVTHTSVK